MTDFYSESGFFDAWNRGVAIAGVAYFGTDDSSVGAAMSKWDLTPRIDAIRNDLRMLSSGEATLLAAMVGFYNADIGAEMQQALGLGGLADICANLDEKRRRVIADLLVSYSGW